MGKPRVASKEADCCTVTLIPCHTCIIILQTVRWHKTILIISRFWVKDGCVLLKVHRIQLNFLENEWLSFIVLGYGPCQLPCISFQQLLKFSPGPFLMNPLLNVILVTENRFPNTDLRNLPSNVEAVISPTDKELCHVEFMDEPEQVRHQSKIM